MKIIARKSNKSINDSTSKEDIFIIEASRRELSELGSLSDNVVLEPNVEINIVNARARLNVIKNISTGDNFKSVLSVARELVKSLEAIDGDLITLVADAKAIDLKPE